MDAGLKVVFTGEASDELAIPDISLVKGNIPIQGRPVPMTQVIEHDDGFPIVAEAFYGHAANVARAACHQNCHWFLFTPPEQAEILD
jgi:hypothetical protein